MTGRDKLLDAGPSLRPREGKRDANEKKAYDRFIKRVEESYPHLKTSERARVDGEKSGSPTRPRGSARNSRS